MDENKRAAENPQPTSTVAEPLSRAELAEAGIFPAREPSTGSGRGSGRGGKRAGAGRPKLTPAQNRERLRQDLINIPAAHRKQILDNLVRAARRGEVWAVTQYLDRALGKPVQALEHKAEGGYLPLVVGLPAGVIDPNADAVDGEVVPPQGDADPSSLPPPQP